MQLPVYGVKEKGLGNYVTSDKEKRKGKSRIPIKNLIPFYEMEDFKHLKGEQQGIEKNLYDPKEEPILFKDQNSDFKYLSNEYLSPFESDGKVWPSVEHYY